MNRTDARGASAPLRLTAAPLVTMPHRSIRRLALALGALAPAVLACAHDGPTLPDATALRDGAAQPVALTRLRPDPYPLTFGSGLREPSRTVVRDDALWRATWAAIWSGHEPPPDVPAVDFAREMVIVAALGERSSGGYGILVDSAAMRGGTLVVHVRTLSPGPRCYVTAALTQPVDAVRIARFDGPVEFRDRAVVANCD